MRLMGETTRWSHLAIDVVRWSVRVLGALLATYFFFMLLAHALGEEGFGEISVAEAIGGIGMVLMALALYVSWFSEGVAGAALLVGCAIFVVSSGRILPPWPYLPIVILGLLFLFFYWRSRKGAGQEADRNTRQPAIRAVALLSLIAGTTGVFLLMETTRSRERAMLAAETDLTGRWRSLSSDTVRVLEQDGDSLFGSLRVEPGVEYSYELERSEGGSFEGVVRYDRPCPYALVEAAETRTVDCSFEEKLTLWLVTPERIEGEGVHVYPLSADPADVRDYCESGCTQGVEREASFVWIRED
jgi:hypothetical protein